MPKVKFIEVGRNKKTWEAECKGKITETWMYGQAKTVLMSRDILFDISGDIIAGFRVVGKFEIIEVEAR